MMKYILSFLLILTLWLSIPVGQIARADGIILPEPPICPMPICIDPPCPPPPPCPPVPIAQLVIRYHHVTVTIEDQLAITQVNQTFYNPNDWAIEGTYLFPIPVEAALTSFKLWVDGKAVHGEVLEAEKARQICSPLLTDLSLDFGAIETYDVYPSPLPDLFAGSQILIVGRYRGGGRTDIRLSGEMNGTTQTFVFRDQFFNPQGTLNPSATQAVIPRLWATRKIRHLLTQIRLKGVDRETIEQIVRLSIRYGIVTPYTSYLVSEQQPIGGGE